MIKKILLICFGFCNYIFSDQALVISDVHFNPFAECSKLPFYCTKLDEFIKKPFTEWEFNGGTLSNYKEETNNYLLTTALKALNQPNSLVKASLVKYVKDHNHLNIFVTGDLLTHLFNEKFKYYKPSASDMDISKFAAKTLLYVIYSIYKTFPNSSIYFTLGNNDTDNGDYNLPTNNWLEIVADGMKPYLPDSVKLLFANQFIQGGYYSIPLSNSLQLIAINNNILSKHTTTKEANYEAANREMNWFNLAMESVVKQGKKVILIQHIPFGIDVYSSTIKESPILLQNPILEENYTNLINKYRNYISVIYSGHFHAEYFQEVFGVPVVGTIAFNRYFGNNMGLKIIDYNESTGNLQRFTTFVALNNHNSIVWKRLYCTEDYGSKILLSDLINGFSSDKKNPQVKTYRANYNGDSQEYPQPISSDRYWGYYYCFMNYISMNVYNRCLKSF